MPLTAGGQNLGVDSASVVPHLHPQFARGVTEFHLNLPSPRMAHSVDQGLSGYAINIVAQQRMQGALVSFHNDSESDGVLSLVAQRQFLLHPRECALQVERGAA